MASISPNRRARKRGNGEGSIYQRADGLWVASLMVGRKINGQPDRRFLYAKTRAECQKKLDALRERTAAGQVADAKTERTTVAGYLTRWLEAIDGTVRESTWRRYADIVRIHINPSLGTGRLTALRADTIQRLYAAKRATGLSPRSVRYIHATLHRALGQAVRWGLVPRNAASVVDPPRIPKHELHPPSAEEVVRLLDAAWEQATGWRPSGPLPRTRVVGSANCSDSSGPTSTWPRGPSASTARYSGPGGRYPSSGSRRPTTRAAPSPSRRKRSTRCAPCGASRPKSAWRSDRITPHTRWCSRPGSVLH
jgi:hypothetical protein